MRSQRVVITASMCINGLLAGWMAYNHLGMVNNLMSRERSAVFSILRKNTKNDLATKVHRVAILKPASSPTIEDIKMGFMDELGKDQNVYYEFKEYDAQGNRTLLRSQVEEILDGSYDLVFSMGTQATLMMKEVGNKRQKNDVPTLFVGIKDPVELNLIESEQSSKNNFTGIAAVEDFELMVALLCLIKKNLRNVLIPYDPAQLGGQTAHLASTLAGLLEKRGINVKLVEVFNVGEIAQKVAPFMENADVLLTLRDHTTFTGIETLVKLCNQYHVTLFASDLDSVKHGAVLGFGFQEYDTGVAVGQRARKILIDGVKPSQIPITGMAENYRVRLNTEAMKDQNLVLDPNLFFLMTNGEVI